MRIFRTIYRLLLVGIMPVALLAQIESPPDASISSLDPIPVPQSATDAAIEQRLISIFKEIEPLRNVKVDVASGVVKLRGVVPNTQAIADTFELAKSMEGAVYVVNELSANVDIGARLNPAFEKASELGTEALRKLPILLIAILVVFIFWISGAWLSQRKTWLKMIGMNDLSANLLQRFVKLAMIALGVFIALEIMDATAIAGAVLGAAGIAGIALGFAFRNIVENYLAGILLSLRNPFATGDAVSIEGVSGKVIRLTSRDTVLMTFDGNHLRIPNSKIMTSTMTNFTRNPLRRFDFAIGISVELDILDVRALGLETLKALDSILDDPAPMIVIEELGDSTINMRFFAWIDQRKSDFLKSKSEAIRLIKDAFDDADIEMPEPIYRVHLRDAGASLANLPQANKPKTTRASKNELSEVADTAVDTSMDRQVEMAQSADDEPNLLEDK